MTSWIESSGLSQLTLVVHSKFITILSQGRKLMIMFKQCYCRVPANLRPFQVTNYMPYVSDTNRLDFNSNAFIWRYLNRTVYRSPEMLDDASKEDKQKFMHWLRNKKVSQTETEKALKEEFNLKIVYPEEMFYRTHKIS